VAEGVRFGGVPGGGGCQQRAVPTSRSPRLGGMRFHSGKKPRPWLLRGAFQVVLRQRIISPGCVSTPTLRVSRSSSGSNCMQRGRPCTPSVQGGLMDREAGFQLAENARKGLFFYFFVVQRGMDGDLPGKRKRDARAQQMRLFFFYIVILFSCPGSQPTHSTSRPPSQKPGKKRS